MQTLITGKEDYMLRFNILESYKDKCITNNLIETNDLIPLDLFKLSYIIYCIKLSKVLNQNFTKQIFVYIFFEKYIYSNISLIFSTISNSFNLNYLIFSMIFVGDLTSIKEKTF